MRTQRYFSGNILANWTFTLFTQRTSHISFPSRECWGILYTLWQSRALPDRIFHLFNGTKWIDRGQKLHLRPFLLSSDRKEFFHHHQLYLYFWSKANFYRNGSFYTSAIFELSKIAKSKWANIYKVDDYQNGFFYDACSNYRHLQNLRADRLAHPLFLGSQKNFLSGGLVFRLLEQQDQNYSLSSFQWSAFISYANTRQDKIGIS